MAMKPLTSEAIALTEKKMDMTLDDIIKMSQTHGMKPKRQRVSNKGEKFVNKVSQDNSLKGALAQRRSNFQANQFPLATEAAKKADVAPIRGRAFNRTRRFNVNKRVGASTVRKNVLNEGRFTVKKPAQVANVRDKQKPQTLDSLFATMKEERMRAISRQNNNGSRINGVVPWARGYQHN
ncbi:hypothetical protein OROGR_012942 [Orobanche gracilis]